MNHTNESFEKFTKHKAHEADNVAGRKGWKKRSYSAMRGLKRSTE